MKYKCEFDLWYTDSTKSDYNLSSIYLEVNELPILCIRVKTSKEWEYIGMDDITIFNEYEALTRFIIGQKIVWDKLKEVLQGYLGVVPDMKHPTIRFEIDLPWKNNLKQRLRKEIDKVNRELSIKKNKYHIKGE